MKHTYYLNCTIFDWSADNVRLPLYSSNIKSNDLEYLEGLYNQVKTKEVIGKEFEPNFKCIKFSIAILVSKNDDVSVLKEKYFILELKKYFPEFWKLFESLNNCLLQNKKYIKFRGVYKSTIKYEVCNKL